MTKTPSPEQVIEQAKRALDNRINSIRIAVEARQNLDDLVETVDRERAELEARISQQISDAHKVNVMAYNAAIRAGWSIEELRKIGLPQPKKTTKPRTRPARKPVSTNETVDSATENNFHSEH